MSGPTRTDVIQPADTVVENNRTNQAITATLRYPSDISTHGIVFTFRKYQYAGGGEAASSVTGSSIVLPLPRSLIDMNSIDARASDLDISGAGVVDAAQHINGNNPIDFRQLGSNAVTGIGNLISGNSGAGMSNYAAFAKYAMKFASQISTPVNNAAEALSGTLFNPHTTLLFNSIALKNFSFDWVFAPKNEEESTQIKDIIKQFRKNALPAYESPIGTTTSTGAGSIDRAMFSYPNIVDVILIGLDPEYYVTYKPALITSINADYASQGQALLKGTSHGSRPALVTLTVTMTEADIHTQADYN